VIIRRSSGKQLDVLIADLSADRSDVRDAAIARIAVLGERAVERLVEVVDGSKNAIARLGALQALEAISSPRALDVALQAVDDPNVNVVIAAIGVMRAFLKGPRGVAAVDRLTTISMDRSRPDAVRGAALRMLESLDARTVAPLREALRADPQAAVAALAADPTGESDDKSDLLREAVQQPLPDDASGIREAVKSAGDAAPLALLHQLIERIREREQAETGTRRAEWTGARAITHLALARRGSRLALYDLRESLEAARGPLPVEFLAALREIGDVSCLEPLALAYSHAPSGDNWWRRHLLDAFRAIVGRARLTRRHAVMKRIALRTPDILNDAGA
jgi:HEAT repeat protein